MPYTTTRINRWRWPLSLLLIIVSVSNCAVVLAQPRCQENGPTAAVDSIAPGVYLRRGQTGVVFETAAIANVGFIVGDRCVAVIDTGGSIEEGEALRCAVEQTTDRPICYVILTHVHPDHSLGTAAFRDDAIDDAIIVIGHERLARAQALLGPTYLKRAADAAGRELGPDYIVLPQQTVSERQPLTLDLGDRPLTLRAHGRAHTDHDLSIFDSVSQTLWLSDLLFINHIPVVHVSVLGWLGELDALSALPAARAVPGHGPVQDWPAGGDDIRRYLSVLRDDTRAWLAQDGDLKGALDGTIGASEAARWQLFDVYHKRNISAAYTELEWEE